MSVLNDSSVKNYIEVTGFVVIIGMLSFLLYQVSKPPLINQETIAGLERSVSVIEKYTSRMTVLTELSRQQVKENDLKYAKDKISVEEQYDNLSAQYGISKNESDKINIARVNSSYISGMCSENKNR